MHARLLQLHVFCLAPSPFINLSLFTKLMRVFVLVMTMSLRRQNKRQRWIKVGSSVWSILAVRKRFHFYELRLTTADGMAARARERPHLCPSSASSATRHCPSPFRSFVRSFEVTFVRFISSGQGRDSEGERKEGRKEKREEGEEEEEGRKKY